MRQREKNKLWRGKLAAHKIGACNFDCYAGLGDSVDFFGLSCRANVQLSSQAEIIFVATKLAEIFEVEVKWLTLQCG